MKITNRKYKLLKESLGAMKDGDINILTLFGSPGMGKTHTALECLRKQDTNYVYINSYATPLSFYKLLYENRNKKIIVFDDLVGVSNPLVLSMLKSACWISDKERIVSYYSTSNKMDLHGLPESFTFTSEVVLIFNQPLAGYEPITNRGITIDFNFSFSEKIKIFEDLKDNIDEDVLKYVKLNCDEATGNLSVRTLVNLSKLKKGNKDFKLFAQEMLKKDESKRLLLSLSAQEWSDKTGRHIATFYRHKIKHGLK